MRALMGGLAVLLAVVATPASAVASSSVVVPDGCGDASRNVVTVNGTGVPVPTDRGPSFDISSATLTAVTGGGVEAQLKACGPIVASDAIGGSWQIGVSVNDQCWLDFVVADTRTDGRAASMGVTCPSVLHTPVQDLYGGTEVFSRALRADEWSVAGDTVSFHLSPQALHVVHVGTTLSDPSARTWDGARMTEMYQGDLYSVNGPGVRDEAHATGTLERQ